MNEGHCSFLTLVFWINLVEMKKVRALCHFTTHTPVPAEHDHFSMDRKTKLNGLLPNDLTLPSIKDSQRLHMKLDYILAELPMECQSCMAMLHRISFHGRILDI